MNITTFFSYKGGAGRSTTCLNTIPFIAEREEAFSRAPLILVDMDIESAGMTYLLNKQDAFKGKNDVKILLKNQESWSANKYCELEEHPFYQWLVPVGNQLGLADNKAVTQDILPIPNFQPYNFAAFIPDMTIPNKTCTKPMKTEITIIGE